MCISKGNKIMNFRKDNRLVHTKYSLGAIENRIFLASLYKVQNSKVPITICTLTNKELEAVIPSRNQRNQEKIEGYLNNLLKSSIEFLETVEVEVEVEDDEEKDKVEDDEEKDKVEDDEEKDKVEDDEEKDKVKKKVEILRHKGGLNFIGGWWLVKDENECVTGYRIEIPALLQKLCLQYMSNGYTPENLAIMFTLINPNAQRLYEFIRIWSGSKKRIKYTIEDLREYLKLKDKYSAYADFKKRVLIPAVKELNKKANMYIEMEEEKERTKVVSVTFIVDDKEPRTYYMEKKDVIEDNSDSTVIDNSSAAVDVEDYKVVGDIVFNPKYDMNAKPTIQDDLDAINEEKVPPIVKDKVESKDKNIKQDEESSRDYKSNNILPANESYLGLDFDDFAPGTKKKVMKELKTNSEFNQHNWNDGYAKEAWDIAVMATLDLDESEKISALQYRYFKETLQRQLDVQMNNEIEEMRRY